MSGCFEVLLFLFSLPWERSKTFLLSPFDFCTFILTDEISSGTVGFVVEGRILMVNIYLG